MLKVKKRIVLVLSAFLLAACTNEEDTGMDLEEELKSSIKYYLDRSDDLMIAMEPFWDVIDEDEKLTTEELEKLNDIYALMRENDENFANYITENILPEGFEEDTERISTFMISENAILFEFEDFINDVNKERFPKVNGASMVSNIKNATGKEQKKIEYFLDKHQIKTKAFGRE